MTDRRSFIKQSAVLAAAGAAAGACAPAVRESVGPSGALADAPSAAGTAELMAAALDAARTAGASYADVRIQRQRQNFVFTREQQIQNVVDTDSLGCGVRTLVDGTWGFAATRWLTRDAVAAAAREAVAIARANQIAGGPPVEWLPAPAHPNASWRSAFQIDPWDVPLEEKADLLLSANAAAMAVDGVRFVNSGLFFVKEDRNYANTDGSSISQVVIRSWPVLNITAVAPDFSDFQSRGNVVQPMARGWEYVRDADLVGNAPRWAEEAVQKLSATPVEVGRYDLILDPTQPLAHDPREHRPPDRAGPGDGLRGELRRHQLPRPPEAMLGKLKYGPEFMNVQGDRSQEGALSTIGYDDDGVRPQDFLIVKNGIFNDYQTTREQAPWLRWWYEQEGMPVRSHGCSYAQGWNRRAVPAHAERIADAGRAGPLARRPRRRDRPRHPDRRRRQLLDRPAALQRAVRRPAVLRDPRTARSPACSRTSPTRSARRTSGTPWTCSAGGAATSSAAASSTARASRAGERGEPRVPAGPLPKRQRDQHREDGLT
jgi:TldD protein